MKKVQDQLAKVATELKMPVPASASAQSMQPGKSTEARSLPSDGNQEAFIRSMVDRLAIRMENKPGDLEGWLKLGRSYKVLGEYDKAARAYEKALALAPDNPEVHKLHQAASQLEIEAKR